MRIKTRMGKSGLARAPAILSGTLVLTSNSPSRLSSTRYLWAFLSSVYMFKGYHLSSQLNLTKSDDVSFGRYVEEPGKCSNQAYEAE